MKIKFALASLLVFVLNIAFGQEVLTLEQAINIALKNNFAIEIVRNQEQIATNNNTFGNKGYLPSLDATFGKTENKYSQELVRADGNVVEGDGLKSDNLSVGLALNWTIFEGFRMVAVRDRLDRFEASAQLNKIAAVANLTADVMTSYYAIVQQEELALVTSESMELSRKRKDVSDARLRIGSGSRLMLLQSQVDFNADSALLIRQEVDLKKAKAAINQLLGRDIRTQFEVINEMEIDNSLSYDELFIQLKSQNPNLQIARIDQELSSIDIKEFKSQFYPRANVFGSFDYSKNNFPAGFSFTQNSTRDGISFGFGISWNLFNGTYISPNYQTAKIELINSELQIKENESLLANQLYQAFMDYEANLRLVALESSNLEVARENVDLAFKQYQQGVINDIDLREIQLKQVQSETNLLVAQYLAKQSEIALKLISGSLEI
ncbi:MAG: TolC family protein [Cyclobacteriaceae bacterium]